MGLKGVFGVSFGADKIMLEADPELRYCSGKSTPSKNTRMSSMINCARKV